MHERPMPTGAARCADCAHAVIPPDTDPVAGWRLCAAGQLGGFAQAAHWCGHWQPANRKRGIDRPPAPEAAGTLALSATYG